MTKKYVKTEVLTISRTEELSIIEEIEPGTQKTGWQLFSQLWHLLKKIYVIIFEWRGTKKC